MTDRQLRKFTISYFNNPNAFSLNAVERKTEISKHTLIRFIRGEKVRILSAKKRALIMVVAPWYYDPLITAANIRKQFLSEFRSDEEISQIVRKLAEPYDLST